MFFDASGVQIPCPDPRAGLYIRTRQNQTLRVAIPSDCTAFQIGETAQIHSGGALLATPHCVRAANAAGVSRATLAVFMEPMMFERMDVPVGADAKQVEHGTTEAYLPKGVPPLHTRWSQQMDFAGFSDATLKAYYGF
jgi:isopenicillin N synthase-like dioxygenase